MADSIITKVGMNDSAFQAGVGRIKGGLSKLNRAFGLVGAGLSVGALATFARNSLQLADDLGTAAATIGVSTDFLQEFQYAAEQSGISTDKATMGLQRFTRRLAQAQAGTGELLPTLKQLGIAMFDQEGRARSSEEVLGDFADALKNIQDPQAQLLAGFKAFDSEGAQLIAMLKNGSKGLEELRAQAHEAGVVLDEELIRDLDKSDKALKRIGRRAKIEFAKFMSASVRAFKISQRMAEDFFTSMFLKSKQFASIFINLGTGNFVQAAMLAKEFKFEVEDITDSYENAVSEVDSLLKKENELLDIEERRRIAIQNQTKAMQAQMEAAKKVADAEASLKTAKEDRSKLSVKDLAALDNDTTSDPILKKLNEQIAFAKAGLDPTGKQQFINPQFEKAKLGADRIAAFEKLGQALAEQGNTARSQRAFAQADKLRAANPFLKSSEQNPFKVQMKQLEAAKKQLDEAKALNHAAAPNGTGLSVVPKMPNT